MSYEVQWSAQAKRFLKRLDKVDALRVLDKFKDIRVDPFRYVDSYQGDNHKIRIGDFRALLDIDQSSKTIYVRVFDKRGRIYK